MTFAFAAAGTGGHVYPALAVADELVASGVDRGDIVFVGGDRVEASAIPGAGYRFVGVEIRGLRRSASPQNLRLPSIVWKATQRLVEEFKDRRTRVVTAFGGYVSVPAAWAARRCGATLFVQEQNAVPGLANRIISRGAATSFVAFPAAVDRLRHTRLVGNPLRSELATFDRGALRAVGRSHYGLDQQRPVLGVLGGSLGARVLNEITARIADAHDPQELGIVHLTGTAHHDAVAALAAASPLPWVPLPFEDHMELFYAAADVVLSRAGALTISELAATGTPAVVVPFAAGTAGHQSANAAHLEESGGVVVVPETEVDRVSVELQQLLADEPRRAAMARAAAAAGRPDAARQIAAALREAAA